MDQTSHLQTLTTRHANLEEQLRQERSRPAPDDATIAQIKRQKLRIKEMLVRA